MNQILTPDGYVNISDINIGDHVVAYDFTTGEPIINTVESKEVVTPITYGESNEDGSITPDILTGYVINDIWTLCKYQSIWIGDKVKHASDLQVGDTIFNGFNEDVIIESIEEIELTEWLRLAISGDHSFIADNLTLHNASRFWVGGTANWDASTTTNWSSTSGGSGGSSVPTSADDVTFDNLSNATAYTCTLNQGGVNCSNLTINAPASGAITFTTNSGTRILNIFGNLYTAASGVTMSYGGTLTMSATSGTKTLTSNGTDFVACNVNFNGVGGTFQFADNFTWSSTATITYTNGTIDPNSKTVSLTSTSIPTLSGNLTFYNLTRTGGANKTGGLLVSGNITITNSFTANGNSVTNRLFIRSGTLGTAATITSANNTITNADFMDITGAGAGSWNLAAITGNSGDCGGNSGITFTTAATQTATGTSSFSWSTHGWTSRVPLPQDDVVINNAFSASQTITVDMPRLGKNISCNCTGSPIFSMNVSGSESIVFGSIDMTGIGSISGSATPSFYGRANYTIKSNGLTWGNSGTTAGFNIQAFGGTYTLSDNLTATNNGLGLTNGTFDANGKNVTVTLIRLFSTSNTRAITFGNGTWTLTGNNTVILNASSQTNFTISRGNPVVLNYSGSTGTRTLQWAALNESNSLDINITAGTDIIASGTTVRYRNVDFTGFAGTWNKDALFKVDGNLKIATGMIVSAQTSILQFLGTSGVQSLTTNTKNLDFPVQVGSAGTACSGIKLLDACAVGSASERQFVLASGSIDMNGFNLTHFGQMSIGSNSDTRSLIMGSQTYNNTSTSTSTAWTYSGTGFTITGTGTLKFSGSTANVRTFAGGGAAYPTLWYTNATANGELDITGSNTFTIIKYNDSTAQTIKFEAASTNTIASISGWQLNGTSGNLLSISSITGAQHILSISKGNLSAQYLSLTNSKVQGGARWFAGLTSTNVSGNNGWRFTSVSNRQMGGIGTGLLIV